MPDGKCTAEDIIYRPGEVEVIIEPSGTVVETALGISAAGRTFYRCRSGNGGLGLDAWAAPQGSADRAVPTGLRSCQVPGLRITSAENHPAREPGG